MRRFKKKLLGWLNPKTLHKHVIQKRDLNNELMKLNMRGIDPVQKQLSKNIICLIWKE